MLQGDDNGIKRKRHSWQWVSILPRKSDWVTKHCFPCPTLSLRTTSPIKNALRGETEMRDFHARYLLLQPSCRARASQRTVSVTVMYLQLWNTINPRT